MLFQRCIITEGESKGIYEYGFRYRKTHAHKKAAKDGQQDQEQEPDKDRVGNGPVL